MVPSMTGPSRFNSNRIRLAILLFAVVFACGLFVLTSVRAVGHSGFPLDDSWIHQTYARNLVQHGEWSFVPGVPSTGATSILWPILLAPAHVLSIDPRVWAYLLGGLCLLGTAWLGSRFFHSMTPVQSLLIGIAIALEWHLVWAAVSGMETILFSFAVLAFWFWCLRHHPGSRGYRWRDGLLLGLWGGGLMLVRPEGVVAPAIAGLAFLFASGSWRQRLIWALSAGIGLILILIPYLAFNQAVSGDLFPNTFYAKQTEYRVLWSIPYLRRLFDQAFISLVGPQIILIPGMIALLAGRAGSPTELLGVNADPSAAQNRRRIRFDRVVLALPMIWVLCHWALFAARLPQTYQHGRYAIPTVPLLIVYGTAGVLKLAQPRSRRTLLRISSLAWLAVAGILFPGMLIVLGAPAYAADVAFIEDEMVASTHWLNANTDPQDVIAAHDIGALGYFAPRPLVDLAGLVSPEVIPFMTDPDQLLEFIQSNDASYLIIFPRWSTAYEDLAASPDLCPQWSAADESSYVDRSGAGPMTIYEVNTSGQCER